MGLYGQKDTKAEPYLDKFSKMVAGDKALYFGFDYLREDQQNNTDVEGTGNLVIMGDKYKLEVDEAIIFFDGETQFSLNQEIEEVYVSKPDPENTDFMFTDPIKSLKNYKETFKYRLMGELVKDGRNMVEIQLYPIELGGPYALIKLFFTADTDELYSIVVRHKEGILYTMTITSLETKPDPGIDFFRFNQADFPSVDVIELID